MVTVLDIGLIKTFDFVFPVLLVWAFVFAMLQKTEVVGKNTGINATIASAASLMILLSRTVIDMINFMIPWFSIAIIFFLLMLMLFMIFGAKAEGASYFQDKSLRWVLIAVGGLIFFAAIGNVLGQSFLEAGEITTTTTVESGEGTSDFQKNIIMTLRNPKVLGIGIIFAIVVFAIALLSGAPESLK